MAHVASFRVVVLSLEFLMKSFDIFFHALNQLGLVLLNGSTDLVGNSSDMKVKKLQKMLHTLGRKNSALNLENTRNISLAFLAVARRSRNLEVI